jgi:ABC-type multidrug transport system ATPase subunit
VCLDEPTKGMNILEKTNIQRAIRYYGKNSAIFVTTESIEEAQVLHDNIGFLNKGIL